VLRQLARELGADGVRALLADRSASELGRLVPELAEPAGQPAEPYQGDARARLFEQVLGLLGRLAQTTPVALIIEDAHWADRSTRDLLTFLIANPSALRGLLIVVTFRSDELTRTHPLRPLLAELERISWVERTELPRLTRPEAAEQMAAILGHQPAETQVDTVFRRSDGNPLFVEHVVGCDAGGAASLRNLMLASVQRLPEQTAELLRVASASDGSVGHALLARVSGIDHDELSRALRPAVAANVLLAGGDGYRFRHALIREVMHSDLLPGEHSGLHARYAKAIAADPTLVPAGRAPISLAYHWHSAHDLTMALTSAWQAATAAGNALAYSEQLGMLTRVLELWDRVADASQRIGVDHVSLLTTAAEVAELSGESDRGAAFATAALREVDARTEPARAAQRGRRGQLDGIS
jgi:predicted ATPase